MSEFRVHKSVMNPLGYYLLDYMRRPDIRNIILYGGSSSGKSYSVAQLILIMALYEGENAIVMRKVGASISKSIYEDFKVAARQLHIFEVFRFKETVRQIVCTLNNAKIDFTGLDDPEKKKGISNYKRVVMDEWSEYTLDDYNQIRKRLRGKKGQQIITTFNPIEETHWIKTEIFDKETWHDIPMEVTIDGFKLPPEYTKVKSLRMNAPKLIQNPRTGAMYEHPSDAVVIQTTYLNNFWVVGSPDGTFGYYDAQCIADFEYDRLHYPDFYNVYALGEWGVIRTGSEFFGSFNRGMHTGAVEYNPELPVHISVDSNVLPYITTTYWQIEPTVAGGAHIRQIGETLAGNPDNTVRKAARLVARHLESLGAYKVYLHGDASTRTANNIDDEKRSFLDLFIDTLQKEGIEVEDCVGTSNPNVAMTGEFMNAIYEGIVPDTDIFISDKCKTSIDDYMSVQKDVNGSILKVRVKNKTTGQTYEPHGHISDTARYLVTDILRERFLAFSNRRKRNLYARDGSINFYNPKTEYEYGRDIVYAMPNVDGKFVMVHGKRIGKFWHVVGASIRETVSTDEIKETIKEQNCPQTVIECSEAYFRFVKELRRELSGVKVIGVNPDVERRIAATSDYVRNNILFNEELESSDAGYAAFLTSLLDYNKDGGAKSAPVVLSGFAQFVARL